MSWDTFDVALCCAAFVRWDLDVGADVLCTWQRIRLHRPADETQRAKLKEVLQQAFLSKDADWLSRLTDETVSPLREAQRRRAYEHVRDMQLNAWLGEMNSSKRSVLRTEKVLEKQAELSRKLAPEDSAVPDRDMSQSAARMRMLRWRRRFNVRFGKLRTRERIPLEERRAKEPWALVLGAPLAPFHVGPEPSYPQQVGDHFLGPKFGPPPPDVYVFTPSSPSPGPRKWAAFLAKSWPQKRAHARERASERERERESARERVCVQ